MDRALSTWRQGDCVHGPQWFVFRVSPSSGLSDAARAAVAAGADLVEEEVPGFVVVTQTCDVVRTCAARPYVEVSPLIEVPNDFLNEVKRGRRPAFAFIPALEPHRLVADLDRAMTVEKSVVAAWNRVPGWTTDPEIRALAAALARKRVRFAFPDDFVHFVRPLQDRLTGRHGRDSPEGRALRSLREIRVGASPSWDDARTNVMFYFIRTGEPDEFTQDQWVRFLETWLGLIPADGRFGEVEGLVTTLEGLTAADYVASDPLDLDHLSA
ncbi:MAG: hypothetical protein HOP16_14785 [Acidobacteria bacterium]|nr:hypothetical protein [Acidobacteriota bacterium]